MMRLSDAIAVGRTIPEGMTADVYIGQTCSCACAVGMAEMAHGLKGHDTEWVLQKWPWLGEVKERSCPGCNERLFAGGIGMISHVMGHVKGRMEIPTLLRGAFREVEQTMTLDQLIDWVRSVEPQENESLPSSFIEIPVASEVFND